MKKYNCNNTLEYVHEAARMCRAFDKCNGCDGCPLVKKSCCGIFDVTPEHIRRVQAWSDNHPEITLTGKQVEIFKALNLLGFRYIAKDSDGAVYAFTERPGKGLEAWGGNGEYFSVKVLRSEVSAAISALVNWSDEEPLCIAEALEQAEEANP
uniref:Uncharacterized protein n=1 Tax=Siphoviridae sp. ctXBp18 TaxID=2825541 RepID=A0A8S5PIT6_9CAUD|nr:MAG TPA: hypothetical protein [Siphoviridae sp. ctXBp18]